MRHFVQQIIARYHTWFRQSRELFRHIFEFPNIARPVVTLQNKPRFVVNLNRRRTVFFSKIYTKFAKKHINIVWSFLQARYANRYSWQTIKQIFSKFSLLNRLLQLHICCRNYSNIGFFNFWRTHPHILAIFQNPQQHCLRIKGQFADFIQENSAAVDRFKIAFSITNCPRKCPFFMPKKLRIDGSFGNCAAIDGNKRIVFANR